MTIDHIPDTSATLDTSARTGPPVGVKVIAVVIGTAVLLSVMVTMFALPAARSAPHHIPIGVVGSAQAADEIGDLVGESFDVTSYSDGSAARDAIESREVYGALVVSPGSELTVLVASAASPTVATMIETMGQRVADATHTGHRVIDVRSFPSKDPHGAGLAAGALPLALGGWISAMVIMLVIPSAGGRIVAALGVSVVGGFALVAILQFVVGTFDGNYWLTSAAGMLGIAATCFAVLGLREALGGAGLVVAAIALILLGNPLSGLASAPEMLPTPWGAVGQHLPPGATGSLLRDVVFFDGNAITRPLVVLFCWLLGGILLYGFGLMRERRTHIADVDVVEFGYRETADA
ncbi:hypothetical protein [Gordonia aichiensis]|uniref:hypothetical protein n=1 Tax=Gordonia aichiensis TaxID=36820 RepID=UPI001FDF94F9|nr:hypothetical protein [Gordonia aichiensis]